jgi:hypothetical protein
MQDTSILFVSETLCSMLIYIYKRRINGYVAKWNRRGDGASVMLYGSGFQTFRLPLTVLRLIVIPPYPVF